MNLSNWLAESTVVLDKAGASTSRLDCLVLISDEYSKDKSWVLAHLEDELTSLQLASLNKKITRRATHEPLAYIRGKSEFYGREFTVNNHILIPRPESETIIDLLKNLLDHKNIVSKVRPWKQIIDVGTGSGCLAISAKLEFPELDVFGTDIDTECIKVAQQNAKTLNADVTFYNGNLLATLPPTVYHIPTTIIANLPYVADDYEINAEAKHEPVRAIFAGNDGLDLYRKLFEQCSSISSIGCIFAESLIFQHEKLKDIAQKSGFKELDKIGLIQVFRRITE